jgi:transposase-like protein
MDKSKLRDLLCNIEKLSYQELSKLKVQIQVIDDKKKVANLLEYKDNIVCGHCGVSRYVKYGRRNDLQRYKCKKCSKTFNQLTGTPLARLRKKGRWYTYSECLNNGLSLRESSLLTDVSMSPAFRGRHRLLANTVDLTPRSMNGVVESSETYFRYSEKGSRKQNKESTVINNPSKVYVFSNRDRNQNQNNQILFKLESKHVPESVMNVISKDILFVSDYKEFYNKLSRRFGLRHGVLYVQQGESVKKQIVHLKNINDYFVRLHDWMKRFNGVATKYLVNYLGWFRELDEHNMKTSTDTRLIRAKSLTTKPYSPLIE